MSRSGGQSDARSPVLKSQNKLDTHISTHCNPVPFDPWIGTGPRGVEHCSIQPQFFLLLSKSSNGNFAPSQMCDLTTLLPLV
ncbi:hypothetical protein TNCV_3634331 [Trichonephila clavipes]|nr:hypothetical protein TNCV_3634331 [Trichonephila clavipes]